MSTLAPMRLLIIRHAQTSWNLEGRAQGHVDIEPDSTGLKQISMLSKAMQGESVHEVWSSDLIRCRLTAEAVAEATQSSLLVRADIRERSFGDWEGSQFTELHKKMAEAAEKKRVNIQEIRPPNGESFRDVWNRLAPLVAEIDDVHHNLAIVTHGGTGSLLLSLLVRGTLESSKSFRFGNTGISELERRPDGLFTLMRYNDTAHLDRMAVLAGSLDGVSR